MILVPTFNVYSDWKAQVGNKDLVYYKLYNPDPAELTPVVLYSTASTSATIFVRYFDKLNPTVLPPTFNADFPKAILCFTLVFAV